jgi:hypothetical protein
LDSGYTIGGQVLVVLRLLQDERVDVERVSGGLSIAEKTRRAGFTELANILASVTRQSQVANIMHAVMEGFASGDFDSITQRIEMLSARLAVARGRENTENPAIADDRLCSVCLSQPIEMIVIPCFHACLCTQCAGWCLKYFNNKKMTPSLSTHSVIFDFHHHQF